MRSRASCSTAPAPPPTSGGRRPARPVRRRTSRTRGSAGTCRSSRRAYGSAIRRPRSRCSTSRASERSSAGRCPRRSGTASCRRRPGACRRSGSRRRRSPATPSTEAGIRTRLRHRRKRQPQTCPRSRCSRPRAAIRAPYPLNRLDEAVGDGVERLVRGHHRRRLGRIGQAHAFTAPAGGWADSGSFPPRPGNRVELLVDGAEALPRMAADVVEAQSHVNLAGWFFTPGIRLGEDGPTLAALLAETAERVPVRVLAWAGAPLPLFHPDRGEARQMRDMLTRSTRVEVELDAKERPMHCHHEKLVLVDDRVAYVGGIDLTTFAGNRLDTSAHRARGELG